MMMTRVGDAPPCPLRSQTSPIAAVPASVPPIFGAELLLDQWFSRFASNVFSRTSEVVVVAPGMPALTHVSPSGPSPRPASVQPVLL